MNPAFSWRSGVLRVETCAASWLLDMKRGRYCRVDRGTVATFVSPHAWHEFHRFTIEANGLVRLVLSAGGDSFLSGWLHTDGCARCGQELRKLA
jgi:hypothetical protein